MKLRSIVLGTVLLFGLSVVVNAADWTLKVVEKEPPKELGESIREQLKTKAIQLLEGDKAVFEFWFVSEVPLRSKPSSPDRAFDALAEATLIGAVALSEARRDYRNDEIAKGVYTMRYALQPQDGSHLGTADYIYFAVLVPAERDPRVDSFTNARPLVRASARGTVADHPIALSLRPPWPVEGESPSIAEPAEDHKSLRMELPAVHAGEKTSVVFELVFEGVTQH